jgi:hypothetical protein
VYLGLYVFIGTLKDENVLRKLPHSIGGCIVRTTYVNCRPRWQWRSKVTPGPGARLLYRAPPLLKKIWKKLKVYIFNEIEIPSFYILLWNVHL